MPGGGEASEGEGSVCTFVSGLETGERTGPREAQSDDGQSQAGQGRSNTGGLGVSCDKIRAIQVIKLIS